MRVGAILVVACLCWPVLAQEAVAEPDYSSDGLNRVFSMRQIDLPEKPAPRFRHHLGYVEFRALGMDWKLMYLPIAMPLSGTALGTSIGPPDPFALTGATIAQLPPDRRPSRRQLTRERRRIRALTARRE